MLIHYYLMKFYRYYYIRIMLMNSDLLRIITISD